MECLVINIEDNDCICTFSPPEKRSKLSKSSESFVKNETMDDEIEKMAQKIVKKNQLKMHSINRKNFRNVLKMKKKIPPPTVVNTLNSKWKGKFGWEKLPRLSGLNNEYIPYIFRDDGKYCSIKMLEIKFKAVNHKFLHADILKCPTLTLHFMTADEVSLMNEINIFHSNKSFGKDLFTCNDILISLNDTIEYNHFLNFALLKMSEPLRPTSFQPRCGFVCIDNLTVPYCVKNGHKLIPLTFINGIDDTNTKEHDLDPWDIAYLKLCCIFRNPANQIIKNDEKGVSLEDLKKLSHNNIEEQSWIKNPHKIQTNEKTPRNVTPETTKLGSNLVDAQKNEIQSRNKEKTQTLSTTCQNALNKEVLDQNIENENKKYIQLPDAPLRKNRRVNDETYTIIKVIVINKFIPCIDYKPNCLLITIKDLVTHVMPNKSLDECEEMLRKNKVDLYHPNKEMRKTLLQHKKIASLEEMVTLVQVSDVIIRIIPKLRDE